MGDALILLGGISASVILLHLFIGVIVGNIYDNNEKNICSVHVAFILYGPLSFSKKIRRRICDKCF